jgi:hypothetical protein
MENESLRKIDGKDELTKALEHFSLEAEIRFGPIKRLLPKSSEELMLFSDQIEELKSVIRSAISIAERRGLDTNWEAFENKARAVLTGENPVTAKTFRVPRDEPSPQLPPAPLSSSITDDPKDPRIKPYTGPEEPGPQNEAYLVLSVEERAKGFIRPVRRTYKHEKCGAVTTMGQALAETYARNPKFYGATYCCTCQAHFPVGEFTWDGTNQIVGS